MNFHPFMAKASAEAVLEAASEVVANDFGGHVNEFVAAAHALAAGALAAAERAECDAIAAERRAAAEFERLDKRAADLARDATEAATAARRGDPRDEDEAEVAAANELQAAAEDAADEAREAENLAGEASDDAADAAKCAAACRAAFAELDKLMAACLDAYPQESFVDDDDPRTWDYQKLIAETE